MASAWRWFLLFYLLEFFGGFGDFSGTIPVNDYGPFSCDHLWRDNYGLTRMGCQCSWRNIEPWFWVRIVGDAKPQVFQRRMTANFLGDFPEMIWPTPFMITCVNAACKHKRLRSF